jgi:hypothetical protein
MEKIPIVTNLFDRLMTAQPSVLPGAREGGVKQVDGRTGLTRESDPLKKKRAYGRVSPVAR